MKKIMLIMMLMAAGAPLYAQSITDPLGQLGVALAAGIAISVAALGGGIGQGLAVSAALEGISRNPNAADKIFTPMIVGLALIESLVIYGLVIAFILQGKI